MHTHGVFRQQTLYQFGPLDEAERTAVEIVFVAHVVHLVEILDTVEVEMVNQFARGGGAVFVDNGEGGRRDDVFHTQLLANGFDKSGRLMMLEILKGLKKQGKTILISSHNPNDIEALCDEVCEIEGGKCQRISQEK